MTSRAIVQSVGTAYRLTGRRLKQELVRQGEMKPTGDEVRSPV